MLCHTTGILCRMHAVKYRSLLTEDMVCKKVSLSLARDVVCKLKLWLGLKVNFLKQICARLPRNRLNRPVCTTRVQGLVGNSVAVLSSCRHLWQQTSYSDDGWGCNVSGQWTDIPQISGCNRLMANGDYWGLMGIYFHAINPSWGLMGIIGD